MFSTLRTRYGIPGVIATVALVFAMTGGAFAAKYLITSTNQISPKVLKKLKGNAGPAGPQGPAGSNGAQGAAGKDGADGKSVTVAELSECNEEERGGAEVKVQGAGSGVEVCEGPQGPEGPKGDPWTAGGTLPSSATETGTWWLTTNASGEGSTSISFPIPLVAALANTAVHKSGDANFATSCPGTVAEPKAVSGHLCVYVAEPFGPPKITPALIAKLSVVFTEGADKSGATLIAFGAAASTPGGGTWAVTG